MVEVSRRVVRDDVIEQVSLTGVDDLVRFGRRVHHAIAGLERSRLSAGAHFAGTKSAMLMQNHGFLAAINGIVSFAQLYRIPLLMVISYRGHFGERDPWQTQGGGATEPLLRALGIPYMFLDDPKTVEKRIAAAQTWAASSLHPAAVLLMRDLMWEE